MPTLPPAVVGAWRSSSLRRSSLSLSLITHATQARACPLASSPPAAVRTPSALVISSSSSHRLRGSSLPTDATCWSEQPLASVASPRETDRSWHCR
ncbi:hypothetical protein AAHA92_15801 [Salvia divinorum]|uniref:Secreted protein n=1 Tax=Salvia divinorum TaxID=28513 RepID=A0ABD1HFV5_SALDI